MANTDERTSAEKFLEPFKFFPAAQSSLDKLALNRIAMKKARAEQAAQEAAIKEVPRSMQVGGMAVNLPAEKVFSQEEYASQLEKLGDPEKALAYKKTLAEHDKVKAEAGITDINYKLAQENFPKEMQLIKHDALARGWDYFQATGDKKGYISMVNPYEAPEDKTVDIKPLGKGIIEITQADGDKLRLREEQMHFLKASHEVQLSNYTELKKAEMYINEREKKIGKKPITWPTPTMLSSTAATVQGYIKDRPEFDKLPKEDLMAISKDISLRWKQLARDNPEENPQVQFEQAFGEVMDSSNFTKAGSEGLGGLGGLRTNIPARYARPNRFKDLEKTITNPQLNETDVNKSKRVALPEGAQPLMKDGKPLVYKKTGKKVYVVDGKYYDEDGQEIK